MTTEIPSHTTDRDNRAGRPTGKQRVADYIASYYAKTKQPICVADLAAALPVSINTVKKAINDLCREGAVKFVCFSGNYDRDDLRHAAIRMFAPAHAPILATVLPAVRTAARPAVLTAARPSISRPAPLAEPRARTPRYVGEVGHKYVPEFRESREREFWTARDLALTQR